MTTAGMPFGGDEGDFGRVKGLLGRMGHEFLVLLRLAKAVKNGHYGLATPQLAALLGALGYVVSPVDAIPDILVGVGFTDDAAVVTATIGILGMEIANFRSWENEHHSGKYRG
ncbi:YkvA family protein [Ornithinimicrobium flavum]|uniref:YkvA family protein n=1 Tax=Ornithinimicrobium flavum TaxID=1288636 RepID=UPI00106F4EE0|nr:DUF1232 domain-containing protein [Ornithinimicrobium flavum]